VTTDPLAPLKGWLTEFSRHVRDLNFEEARAMCDPSMSAMGSRAFFARGLDGVVDQHWRTTWPSTRNFTVRSDDAVGAVDGSNGWIAAPWDSEGVWPDGTTFDRPGRLTVVLRRQGDRWLAVHTHSSVTP
jgi:ketosteroid isomerase-like protein